MPACSHADVDYVICTHLHLDHVGWNTSLVDGQWVPTFPSATHLFNKSEFDFWNPDTNPAHPGLDYNAGVFDDSVRPMFDRGLAQLWDGDLDVDEVFHLDMATGHTAGHHVCWLESKGERALFAGDAMHSPMQVFEPTWNSGFCAKVDEAIATRRRLLEICAERNALLCPAHFAAPHAFRVVAKGNGMMAVRRRLTRRAQVVRRSPVVRAAQPAGALSWAGGRCGCRASAPSSRRRSPWPRRWTPSRR